MIPISRLSVGDEEAAAAAEAIKSGWIAVGKRTETFERLVADYVGAKHAVAVSSATTGLHLGLVALGVGPGDEVICPSFSFIATANAILYAGAKPVFVDIDPRTYNLDPEHLETLITPRTKAILAVSQIGLAADLDRILAIARAHKLPVLEDAAPSLGAEINGQRLGGNSDITVFSFDARKVLTTGEGGVICTNNAVWAERIRGLRAHSASVSTHTRHTSTGVVLEEYTEMGYNYKMTDIQAAMGVVQMGKLEGFLAERRRLADRYNALLGQSNVLTLPHEPQGYKHIYQSYCVRLAPQFRQSDVMAKCGAMGVATRRIIGIHQQPYFRDHIDPATLPATEAAVAQTLLVPMFVGLTEQEQDKVADALLTAVA
jgi:dTDP-4-amino-4,6-dideoxygalactose transaminase